MIPCGLVVRIRRFHRRGRGSIPRMGDFLFNFAMNQKKKKYIYIYIYIYIYMVNF